MVTLKDVAKMAGVSVATVSMVLHKKDSISPATKEKVLECVEALGYRPNMVARGFKLQRTKAIAVLVPNITNPVYPTFVHSIETAARREGYQVILYSYDHDYSMSSNADCLSDLYDRMVDGLIICGIPGIPDKENVPKAVQTMEHFIKRGTPFVFFSDDEQLDYFLKVFRIDTERHGELFHLLSIDRVQATFRVIQHLLSLGHRRIAFITESRNDTYPHNIPFMRKLTGYKQALSEFRIAFDEELVLGNSSNYRGGEDCFIKLSGMDNPPTAYFCSGDIIAMGVLHGARNKGCEIPRDVSVFGFDNIPAAGYWNPKLSTVAVPTTAIAEEAFRRLHNLMNGRNVVSNRMVFDTDLIIRESSR